MKNFIFPFISFFVVTCLCMSTRVRVFDSKLEVIYGAPQTDIKLSLKLKLEERKKKKIVRRLSHSRPIRSKTLIAMIWMLIDLFILGAVNVRRATIILCRIFEFSSCELRDVSPVQVNKINAHIEKRSKIINFGYWCVNTWVGYQIKSFERWLKL